ELEVSDAEVLVARRVPEEGGAGHVKRVAAERHLFARGDVGVGQVDGQDGDLLLDGGAQKEGLAVLEPELEAAQITRPLVIEALLPVADRKNVPAGVEDRERVPVLED